MVSIVIPTIVGREGHYERCRRAYEDRTAHPFEIVTMRNFDGCGRAWNAGAHLARGEYLHFTADDLEPMDGWDEVAIATVEEGFLPAPVTLDSVGRIESAGGHWDRVPPDKEVTLGTCTIPFLPSSAWPQIGPIIEAHYYTDNHFSDRARYMGFEFLVRHGYVFKHHWAKEGRGDEQARMAADRETYQATRRIG